MSSPNLQIFPMKGIKKIVPGDDLVAILSEAIERHEKASGEKYSEKSVLILAQKIVSKAEGRFRYLKETTPSPNALELAKTTGKDPRLVELILSETDEVLRAVPGLIIVRDRRGFVLANAGIDRSNIDEADERVLLLPEDSDASAAQIREGLQAKFGRAPAVIISDSFGRAWRMGTVNVAIGVAGFPAMVDRNGDTDMFGRELVSTHIGYADSVAAAAGLVMGETAEGIPAALVTGLNWDSPEQGVSSIIRPQEKDLFQ